jgi:hypothetical protein
MYGEYTVQGGVFVDFSKLRIYVSVGCDDFTGINATASQMMEFGRLGVILNGASALRQKTSVLTSPLDGLSISSRFDYIRPPCLV